MLAYVETQAAGLEANGKLGTARNYRRTLGSFSDFLGGRDIPFSLVDERLVGQYDDWLRRRGVVRNTVSFYMRILRAVYNRAVKEDVVPQAILSGMCTPVSTRPASVPSARMSSCGSGSWI